MKKEILDELNEISPLLAKAKKPDLPSVPAQYFEGFEARMKRRLEAEVIETERVTNNRQSIFHSILMLIKKPAVAVSMGVAALLVVMTWYFFIQEPADSYAAQLAQLDQQELLSYIENNIDQYEMEAFLGDDTGNFDEIDFTEMGEIPDTL